MRRIAYTLLSFILPFFAFADVQPTSPESNFTQRVKEYAESHQAFKDCCRKEHEAEFFRLAKEGQSPQTLFIGCSDSRVMPNLVTGQNVGHMFIIRNAGNFVSTYDPNINWDGIAASLEYAVEVVGVTDIIVCGHTHCGAIEGLYKDPSSLPSIVNKWIQFGRDAKELVEKVSLPHLTPEDKYNVTAKISVLFQLDHLSSFPFVKKKLDEKKIYLHAWFLDIANGDIFYYDPTIFGFRPLIDVLK